MCMAALTFLVHVCARDCKATEAFESPGFAWCTGFSEEEDQVQINHCFPYHVSNFRRQGEQRRCLKLCFISIYKYVRFWTGDLYNMLFRGFSPFPLLFLSSLIVPRYPPYRAGISRCRTILFSRRLADGGYGTPVQFLVLGCVGAELCRQLKGDFTLYLLFVKIERKLLSKWVVGKP